MVPANTPLSSLPWFPLEPAWIEQSAAFTHTDARLGVAYMRVLLAAWRGLPAATVPASHQYLSQVSGLPVEEVGRNYAVLTEGFELLEDGRLHHVRMERLALRLMERYGKDIEEHALSAAMVMQSPEQFSLVATETARSTTRGRQSIPRGFGYQMHPELRQWAAQNGFPTPEDQDWVMSGFIDYSVARGERVKEWAAAFKVWAARELSFGRRPPSARLGAQGGLALAVAGTPGKFGSPPGRSRAEHVRAHNAAMFGTAARREAEVVVEMPAGAQAPRGGR